MQTFYKLGDRTETLTASTEGTPPIAPVGELLLTVNTTSINLNLASWSSGGCDISSFVIEYTQLSKEDRKGDYWTLVNNNVRPTDLDGLMGYMVLDLVAGRRYLLRITAHNSAGSTVHEYEFSTLKTHEGLTSEGLLINHNNLNSTTSSDLPLTFILSAFFVLLLLFVLGGSVLLVLQKSKAVRNGLKFSSHARGGGRNEPDLTDGLAMASGVQQPTQHRRRGNEYEMSDADLNYGFGLGTTSSTLHQTFTPRNPMLHNAGACEASSSMGRIGSPSAALLFSSSSGKLNEAVIIYVALPYHYTHEFITNMGLGFLYCLACNC